MSRIRSGLEEADRAIARLEAMADLERDIVREADRLAELAADFKARAQELKGCALRELVAPWIGNATFDKETRVLELTIRQVPQLSPAGMGKEPQPDTHGVRARVTFPALERDALGRYRTPTYRIAAVVTIESAEGRVQTRVRVDQYAA
jgi:hypothetical protein